MIQDSIIPFRFIKKRGESFASLSIYLKPREPIIMILQRRVNANHLFEMLLQHFRRGRVCSRNDQANLGFAVRVCFSTCRRNSQTWMFMSQVIKTAHSLSGAHGIRFSEVSLISLSYVVT